MPTYEYACKQCGEHLEVVQSFSDDPLTTCSLCGGDLRKVFGNVGIVFKGSGFYKTDSRGSHNGVKRDKAAEPTPSGEAGAGTKSESAGGGTEKTTSTDKAATTTEKKPAATTS